MDRLGILSGIKSEEKLLARSLPPPDRLATTFRLSGANAAGVKAAGQALREAECSHLLSWGLAGALAPRLRSGDLILPEIVTLPDGTDIRVTPKWHKAASQMMAHLKPATAPLLGVDRPITTIVEKLSLFHRYDRVACAIDMESGVLAKLASENNLKFLVIRVIVDSADMALPPAAQNSISSDGTTDIAAVLRSLLQRPGQMIELMKLGIAATRANRTLLRCADLGGVSGFGIV